MVRWVLRGEEDYLIEELILELFSVVDVVEVLTESDKPRDYWYRLKKRASEEEKVELSTICRQLKMRSTDGKLYKTDAADTEGILRIIQSIPSKKAEPFKRWLAREAVEERLGAPVVSKQNYLDLTEPGALEAPDGQEFLDE